jgi:hypothetical protein
MEIVWMNFGQVMWFEGSRLQNLRELTEFLTSKSRSLGFLVVNSGNHGVISQVWGARSNFLWAISGRFANDVLKFEK